MTTGLFTPGRGSINAQRVKLSHNRAAIRYFTGDNAQHCLGTLLAVRDNAIPPVEAYSEWCINHGPKRVSRHTQIDASKLRRIAQMKRNGCNWSEVGAACGLGGTSAKRWFTALPPELR